MRREELEALGLKATYFEIKEHVYNQHFKFQEKLSREYAIFDRVFELIKAKK